MPPTVSCKANDSHLITAWPFQLKSHKVDRLLIWCDGQEYACFFMQLCNNLRSSCQPSVLQVNTATMKVEMSIHGLRPPPRSVTPLQSTSAAVLAPGGGELVMPTDNSMLQFWDAAGDRHVDKLQVTRLVTSSRHALKMAHLQ